MAGVAACLSDLVLTARAQKISRRAHWLSDPDLRQHSHAGLNKGEASN
jgi:TnpA family transposase